jgi:hypothetical protein
MDRYWLRCDKMHRILGTRSDVAKLDHKADLFKG